MPYSAEISRNNPAGILILVDQSRSMNEPLTDSPGTKADGVAFAVNRLLQSLVLKSAKADGVRDYFHVGVIGYGVGIECGLGGSLPDRVLVPISKVADSALRSEMRSRVVEDASGEKVEQAYRMPVWFEPVANGKTPMHGAFEAAERVLKGFARAHPDSFPPTLLHITDGMPTDANPLPVARRIHQIATRDGNALVYNLLLSSDDKRGMYFLADEDLLTDPYGKLLFRMSSTLPPRLVAAARAEGYDVQPKARGVVFNADLSAVVRFLDIGTRVGSVFR